MINNIKDTDENLYWYKDAIIYELHIKAFYDSNGDGVGDFQGLLEKLDYLEDLGVTAIWLLPFYPSPLRDDGYDIADYYTINPSYGDIRIFKKLIKEAHKRDLKVITELVINHTSDQHPWFQRARKAKPGSNYRNYYVWSDNPDKYKDVRIIFTDYEPSNWTWDPEAKSYYWHRFFSHQPDLNFDNPQVKKEVFKVLDFWCKMGVDGFRLDAVPYLFERENTNCENLPETHEFLKELRAYVDERYENILLLAEANMWPEDSASYFGSGDECHMNYHFPIMPRMFMAVKMEDRYPITDIIDQTPEIPESCQWAIFLRNHDELTLEMVTDEERDYMYKAYTKDAQARINLGIRHRLAPLMENNRSKIELMNVLLFSLPGTPVIYYGDEIGMGDNYYLGDRDGVRTPMQWTADKNAGFSDANPHKLYLPVIIDPEYRYESINVEAQQGSTSSLLWWMKRIINMRKQYKAFGRGNINFLSPANSKIIAFTRVFNEERVLVLCNLSHFPQAAELDLEEFENYTPVEMFSHNKFPQIGNKPYLFTMAPHGYYWFTLEKEEENTGEKGNFSLTAGNWNNLFVGKSLQQLERNILPSYLRSCRWFGGKARIIQGVSIRESVKLEVGEMHAIWLVIKLEYNEGLPELYQLPVAFLADKFEEEVRNIDRKAIISNISFPEEGGYLVDAIYLENFRRVLFNNIRKSRKLRTDSGGIFFRLGLKKGNGLEREKEVSSYVLKVEQSNTSIIFNNSWFLKLYRKIDNTTNPDLEIVRYLTEKTTFKNVPEFVGEIVFHSSSRPPMVLGMMQQLVVNQGDAWDYAKDVFTRFLESTLVNKPETIYDTTHGLSLPIKFRDVPKEIQQLIGGVFPESIFLLGKRTAEMHKALALNQDMKEFKPEAFSLHYQRSIYSSLQTLTRSTFQSLQKAIPTLPEEIRDEVKEVFEMKEEILNAFKRIFSHKINTMKIRTHGDYHLGQVLWTGKDFVIIDFEGEPARAYSERRLKRSPLRDVAGMIRSFHYASYSILMQEEFKNHRQREELERWADIWFYYNTRFFLRGYLDEAGDANFIPDNQEDFEMLLEIFLLEKAVYELHYELNNRPDWLIIPLRGIKSIIKRYRNG